MARHLERNEQAKRLTENERGESVLANKDNRDTTINDKCLASNHKQKTESILLNDPVVEKVFESKSSGRIDLLKKEEGRGNDMKCHDHMHQTTRECVEGIKWIFRISQQAIFEDNTSQNTIG